MSKKILIVEDNELNMKLMADILETSGYEVAKAIDGEEALDVLSEQKFDLMILDIQLPKKSGYEVLQEKQQDVPTIIVSACCMEDEVMKAKAIGCLDYITKPIKVVEFLTKIKSYLAD